MTGTLYTFSVVIRKFWEQVRENEKCYMISIGRVVFSFAFHQVSAGSPHTCWNKLNLVSGPGGERKPKWPQSTCLCSLSSRRLRGRSHSGELILKGTKGKNHPPGFTWNCSLRARRWSSTWNSLQFQSEAEVWGLQLPAQPWQDDLKEKISQIQIEGGSRVSCSQSFLIAPCLRCTEEYFLFFPAHPSSTSTRCPKCKEPLQTSFRVPESVSYSSGRVRCQSEP